MSQQRHVSGGDAPTAARSALPTGRPAGALTLLVFSGDARIPTRAVSVEGPMTVGRSSECSLVLDDTAASRVHVELVPATGAGGVDVVDRGSRNETFVNGKRVSRGPAPAGSVIRVGDSFLRVVTLSEPWRPASSEGPLVGGTVFETIRRTLALIGPTNLPVAVFGETGTGKEIAARQIHAASGRSGPFIAVNCAAIPQALIESELFGHVRGAFSGASQARHGMFSAAHGGTLFLDEVGDLPLDAQAKLLRVLEDGRVRPVGSEVEHVKDVRVVSATNRDLARAVESGTFRSDLLARLSVVELRMPPLRTHPEDLPALAAYLLGRAGHGAMAISADALEAMALHDWPQNMRELDRVLRNAALRGGAVIEFASLPEPMQQRLRVARGAEPREPVSAPLSDADLRTRVEHALRIHRGNVRRASAECGIARGHFYRLLDRWSLDIAHFRESGGTDVAPGETP